MTDMLALIDQVWRLGCPHCQSRDGLFLHRRAGSRPPLVVKSVECVHCAITWEADEVPDSELSTSTPLGHDAPGLR